MKSSEKLHYGHQIEETAKDFLLQQGFLLLQKNFRIRGGEIDLIFEDRSIDGGTELVFVEVRARQGENSFVDGIESVDWKKQRKLNRAIQFFLSRYRGEAEGARVDILSWDGKAWTHLRNVWI